MKLNNIIKQREFPQTEITIISLGGIALNLGQSEEDRQSCQGNAVNNNCAKSVPGRSTLQRAKSPAAPPGRRAGTSPRKTGPFATPFHVS